MVGMLARKACACQKRSRYVPGCCCYERDDALWINADWLRRRVVMVVRLVRHGLLDLRKPHDRLLERVLNRLQPGFDFAVFHGISFCFSSPFPQALFSSQTAPDKPSAPARWECRREAPGTRQRHGPWQPRSL